MSLILVKNLSAQSNLREIIFLINKSHFIKISSLKFSIIHNGLKTQKENNLNLYPSTGEAKLNVYSKYTEDWGDVISRWYKQYQGFVGISEILEAQERVTQITNQLIEVQSQRRRLQREVETVNQQLLLTHQRITKSELYSEDHYKLFENARVLSSNLKELQNNFIKKEEEERDLFTHLSSAIKFCHEKERTQSENSKYWSILLSVVSAALASLITSVNNWVRIKEIKEHASCLHKESMIKNEEMVKRLAIITTLSESGGDYEQNELTFKEIILKLPELIQDEFKKLANTIPTEKMNETGMSPKLPDTVPEVSYVRVMSSMAIGAAVGTLVTAIFLRTFS